MKRPRRNHEYATGALYRLELTNFMSYTHALIQDPGPNLNCILGPNGSGKSSIVCALCVGLAGPLSITERADSIKNCLHGEGRLKDGNGQPILNGSVEIELYEGQGPGQNSTIRLEFDAEGKSAWQLNGRAANRTKVKEHVQSLGIHVDNPLQFLPQDKVGQFSNLSPVELLFHTERAIGPEVEKKHRQLIDGDEDLCKMRSALATEEKALGALVQQNAALERDVERWNRYQEALTRLGKLEGKRLWLRFEDEYARYTELNQAYKAKKVELRDAERKLRDAEQLTAPLSRLARESREKSAAARSEGALIEKRRTAAGERMDDVHDECDEVVGQIGAVGDELVKLTQNRDKIGAELVKTRQQLESLERETSAALGGLDAQAAMRGAKEAVDEAARARDDADADLQAYDEPLMMLVRRKNEAEGNLRGLSDTKRLKQSIVAKQAVEAAQLAGWCAEQQLGVDRVVGPLFMFYDVPKAAHQPLVESAISPKTAFSFLARDAAARDALNRKCQEHRWNVNVYLFEGEWREPARPRSADLNPLGASAWLDEALEIEPELRSLVLGFLDASAAGISRVLLATDAAVPKVDQLLDALSRGKYEQVRVIAPSRVFNSSRSRHGQRALNISSTIPQKPLGLYRVVADSGTRRTLESQLKQAQREIDAHNKGRASVEARAAEAAEAHDVAKAARYKVEGTCNTMRHARARLPPLEQRLRSAEEKVSTFDAEAKREELRISLRAKHDLAGDSLEKMVAALGEQVAATGKLAWARASQLVAEAAIHDAGADAEQLKAAVRNLGVEVDQARGDAKSAGAIASSTEAEAKEKAVEFVEPRSEANEAEWMALPADVDELDVQISELNEETSSTIGDESAVRDYHKRQKQIERQKEELARSTAACEVAAAALKELEGKWRPELEQMVASVDRNFSRYFARFRCHGEVCLADGRELDESGQPVGDDNYSRYKILIKVKWRDSEQLHTLGCDGRDSGGERSVATMIYLISLQNINPAPFRVVDEINQAMDADNERNVFDCITAACRDGGKQYFLLTPKLLPDLDYGEDTAIQLVFNGPYMARPDEFTLARCVGAA